MKAAYVLVDGPMSGGVCRVTGDEFPIWTVTLYTDDDEDIKSYTCQSGEKAFSLGERISRDRKIELVNEASIYA